MKFGSKEFVPVILGTGLSAYGIARSLHEEYGVHSLALGRAHLRETAHSKIVAVRVYEQFDDADFIIRTLNALTEEFPGRTLMVFPTIEMYAYTVIERAAELSENIVVPLPDAAAFSRVKNKRDFYEACEEFGVPYPAYTIVNETHQDDPLLGENLDFPYPAVVKPSDTSIYPRLSFAGRKKVYRVANPTELREVVQLVFQGGYEGDLIVQEMLPGNETIMQVANSFSTPSGLVDSVVVAQVILADQSPTLVGNFEALVPVVNGPSEEDLARLLEGLGYAGFANFDLLLDKRTGVYKVLELNVRLGGASYYATLAGINLPARSVESFIHRRLDSPSPAPQKKLWLNVPYPLLRRYAPKALLALAAEAARNGKGDTLWYREDLSVRRVVTLLEYEARVIQKTIRYHDNGVNG